MQCIIEPIPTDTEAYYYTTLTLNGLHETERFENRMERSGNGTKRFGNGTKSFRKLNNFWERNALYMYALASFSIFPDIRISMHGESTFCLFSLRQNENKTSFN